MVQGGAWKCVDWGTEGSQPGMWQEVPKSIHIQDPLYKQGVTLVIHTMVYLCDTFLVCQETQIATVKYHTFLLFIQE